jgi:O-antigen ligase
MSTATATRAARVSPLAALAALVGVAAVLAVVLADHPPAMAVPAALIGAAGLVAFAAARYELTVAAGFLLLGVVRVEPAPSDALLAVAIGISIAAGRVDLRRVPGGILALIVVLLALNLVSTTAATQLGDGLRFLAITLYMLVLAVWLATYAQTPRRMRLVIGAYVAGACLFAALAVLALFVPFPGHDALTGETGTRAQGLFKDPNVFGPFLIPAALILFEETLRPRLLGLRRLTSAVLLAVLVLGIVFAYSRAAWLNLAVGVLVMLVVMALRVDSGRAAAGAIALVAVVAGLGGAAVVATGSTGFLQERARVQTYDTDRFSAQRTGVHLAEEHLIGVGPGQFEEQQGQQQVSAHSIYIRVLAEQGVLGLVTIVALLGGTLALALGNAAAGRDAHGVGAAALLGAWCGLLANSAFVDTLHWRHLWVVAALIWVAAVRARP